MKDNKHMKYNIFLFYVLRSIFFFHCTVSRNRTRNIAVYTWHFSLLSYDRHPNNNII